MVVNKEIYPDLGTWHDIQYSKNLLDIGKISDTSCIYSSSTSPQYANLSNGIYAGTYAGQTLYDAISTGSKSSIQSTLLVINKNLSQIGTHINSCPDSVLGVKTGSISPQGTDYNYYSNWEIVTGFKYHQVIALPIIYYTSKNTASGDNAVYQEYCYNYFNRTSNYGPVVGVGFAIFSGGYSSRNQGYILPVNANSYGVPVFIFDESNDKFISPEQPELYYNYFPNRLTGSINFFKSHLGVTTYPFVRNQSDVTGYRKDFQAIFQGFTNPFIDFSSENTAWSGNFNRKFPKFNITKNDVLHMCATLGLVFAEKLTTARNADTSRENFWKDPSNPDNDLDIYFPIKNANGYWNGDFVSGDDIAQTEQYLNNWDGDVNAPFTNGSPSDYDSTQYIDDADSGKTASTSVFTNKYLLNASAVKTISNWLNNPDLSVTDVIMKKMNLGGANPIDNIVSLQYYPINLSGFPGFSSQSNVIIGSNLIPSGSGSLVGTVCDNDNIVIDLGSCTIKAKYENYLDYEPYTSYVCYIPFVGFVNLESTTILNNEVSFKLLVEIVNGTCLCEIRVNGRLYKTLEGVIGTSCSIQSIDYSNLANSYISSIGKMAGGATALISVAGGAVTGNVAAVAAGAGAMNYLTGFTDFVTTPVPFENSGKSSGAITQMLPARVCIYRYTVKKLTDEEFEAKNGRACNFNDKLNNLSGFTICGNVDTSGINATEEEKKEIKTLLENGIYL